MLEKAFITLASFTVHVLEIDCVIFCLMFWSDVLTFRRRQRSLANVAEDLHAVSVRPLVVPQPRAQVATCRLSRLPVHVRHTGAVSPAPAGATQAAPVGGVGWIQCC